MEEELNQGSVAALMLEAQAIAYSQVCGHDSDYTYQSGPIVGGSGSSFTQVPPVHIYYGSTALMIAGQGSQLSGWFYHDGDAFYTYRGTTAGTISDYKKIVTLTDFTAISVPAVDYTSIKFDRLGGYIYGSPELPLSNTQISFDLSTLTQFSQVIIYHQSDSIPTFDGLNIPSNTKILGSYITSVVNQIAILHEGNGNIVIGYLNDAVAIQNGLVEAGVVTVPTEITSNVADFSWRIAGVLFASGTVIGIVISPLPLVYDRTDLLVGDSNGDVIYVPGEESSSQPTPRIPANTILLCYLYRNLAGTVVEIPEVDLSDYLRKSVPGNQSIESDLTIRKLAGNANRPLSLDDNGKIIVLDAPKLLDVPSKRGTIIFNSTTEAEVNDFEWYFDGALNIGGFDTLVVTGTPATYDRKDALLGDGSGGYSWLTGEESPNSLVNPATPSGKIVLEYIVRKTDGTNEFEPANIDLSIYVDKVSSGNQSIKSNLTIKPLSGLEPSMAVLGYNGELYRGRSSSAGIYTTLEGIGGFSKILTITIDLTGNQLNYYSVIDFFGISEKYERGQLWIQFEIDPSGDIIRQDLTCFGSFGVDKYVLVKTSPDKAIVFVAHDEVNSFYKFRPQGDFGSSFRFQYHNMEPKVGTLPVGTQYFFTEYINNKVLNLNINPDDLSGTGTEKEQICEYINSILPTFYTSKLSKINIILGTETPIAGGFPFTFPLILS
jgi:hypothetical protein